MSTQPEFITLRVWLPESVPGLHPHNLSLENPNALLFFLEAIARGNVVYPPGKSFVIVAYQGSMQIGQGRYQVIASADVLELRIVSESGEIAGVVQEAWRNMGIATGLVKGERRS